jgi:arylformamidase
MTRVFLDYDQKALDDAYDQSVYAPNREQLLARFARSSEIARKRLGEPQRFAYGSGRNEKLDLFTSKKPNAPVNVFVHGGAWKQGEAKNYHWPAEMLVRAGSHYVALDFDNVVEAEGSLFPMAEQVRRALAWVYVNCAKYGGDPKRIYVSATSSGAHLAGVAATTDWKKDFNLPPDCIKGYVLVSGMYDLRGPRLSKRSGYVKFTDEMEAALSPQRHLERIRAPIVLVHGTLETPEFQRQSREFAAALRAAGKSVELVVAEHYNHFEIAETMGNPYGVVGREILRQMEIDGVRAPNLKGL